jgi:hypothetical protein
MKFWLSFFCFCVAVYSPAQIVSVSNPSKLPAKTGKFKIVGKNNDGIVVRLYGAEDVMNVYSDELKLAASKNIAFKNQTGPFQYIMLNKTGSVIFYLVQDKKYSVLLAQPVNSKFIEIGKAIAIDTIYDRKDLVASNLRFKASIDQNYLFIYYPFFAGGTVQTVKFLCLDHALTTMYNKLIPVNRDEKELEESKSLIDNEGSSYLILKPASKGDGEQFDVFRISAGGDLALYSIATQKQFFGEPDFEIDNKNSNVVLCAFYNDDKHRLEDVANGFLYASYNPVTGAVIQQSYMPFPKQFMTDLTTREVTDRGKLYTFNIKRVVLRNDGGALILAESFIKDTRDASVPPGVQPGFNSFRSSTIYQFNDIIAFSFTNKGEIDWTNIMRKKQASEDDGGVYSSFMIMNEKDRLRLLYLDDINTSGILNEYNLTSDGKSTRKAILNQEDKDVMLLPKMGKQISPREVVVPSYKNASLQLVKITY